MFICPVCGNLLQKEEKAYTCPKGHNYDLAKEGYVYLLPPNKKHSKDPGDNKQMVAARRAFLETGLYQPFSDELDRLALEYLGENRSPVVLDAGCGEGYYTGRLALALGERARVFGFDISKCAVRAAAKRYREIAFAVGSSFGIPFAGAAADLVVNVFAPIVPGELARVVKPGGHLILAVPGERHLYGLKEILYEHPYENPYKETEYPGFTFLQRTAVAREITITDPQTMLNLFAMTPYYIGKPALRAGNICAKRSGWRRILNFIFWSIKEILHKFPKGAGTRGNDKTRAGGSPMGGHVVPSFDFRCRAADAVLLISD